MENIRSLNKILNIHFPLDNMRLMIWVVDISLVYSERMNFPKEIGISYILLYVPHSFGEVTSKHILFNPIYEIPYLFYVYQ